MILDKKKIPETLHGFVDLAVHWGVGDDFEREKLVESASDSDILDLCIQGDILFDNEELNSWLYESVTPEVGSTLEYVTYTNLTMAVDSARFERKRRGI